jgi:hydrogenase nickel incorporation protein HypA/HybF
MHEVHLMGQVVKVVEDALRKIGRVNPSVVRLKVSALSHLLTHDVSALQSAFFLASVGTIAEGASLDIVTVPVRARCRCCGLTFNRVQMDVRCDACGTTDVDLEQVPEVEVHEVVVTE